MDQNEQYQRIAALCLQLAHDASHPITTVVLVEMARSCTRLAETERLIASSRRAPASMVAVSAPLSRRSECPNR
jgi:hypothetical protein